MANKKRQQDEKTKKFKKQFISERENGLSIPEIADKYHISKRHAYNLLQEIADESGVTRESLLQTPHSQNSSPLFIHKGGEEKVNVEEIRKEFQSIHTSAEKIVKSIDKVLEEDER